MAYRDIEPGGTVVDVVARGVPIVEVVRISTPWVVTLKALTLLMTLERNLKW